MANYDIFLLRGHGNGDPGACANGYTDENLAQAIVDRVVELLNRIQKLEDEIKVTTACPETFLNGGN